jgi:putative PIN family toxin of toxin-antitoxin system
VASASRLVLDTNVLLRGLLNAGSAAGHIVHACDRRTVVLVLSKPLLAEYKAILIDPEVVDRYPELTREKIELVLRRLRYVADVLRAVRVRFDYPRDPKDAKFIELAIAGRATHLVTADDDLLSLRSGRDKAAERLRRHAPSLRVMAPAEFLSEHPMATGAGL